MIVVVSLFRLFYSFSLPFFLYRHGVDDYPFSLVYFQRVTLAN
jgi:hypothetical protein